MPDKQPFPDAIHPATLHSLPCNAPFLQTPLTSPRTLIHGSLSAAFSNNHTPDPRPDSALHSTYEEHVTNINMGSATVDYKTVSKHLGKPLETLKMQGGDVARHMYHQLESAAKAASDKSLRRSRLSSFLDYLSALRRESTASDINVPGGFRREFIINRSLQQKRPPPSFLTRNFMEFLTIYGHFAGEDFGEDSDADTDVDAVLDYEDVFDEEALLLHERRIHASQRMPRKPSPPLQGTASEFKTFCLMFKALVGSGILFLPRAFCNGGLIFSTITLAGFGVLTYVCFIVLIRSKEALGRGSFGELGLVTHGRPLKYSIMVSIIISQIGFVATYILFTAENMHSFFREVCGIYIAKPLPVAIQCALLIPLVLIRKITKLSLTSFVSSVFILLGLVIIFYFAGVQLYTHGVGPKIEQFNAASWPMLIGVAVTAFEGIGLILPIQAVMARPQNFPKVLLVSVATQTMLLVTIGVVGYSAYGENVRLIIILNFDQSNMAVQLILVLYSAAVFLTAPLQLFPAIRIGESALFNSRFFVKRGTRPRSSEGKYNLHVKWMKNLFRAAFVVAISVLAYANLNNLDKFVSLNGCFACIPLVYIYPPMIHMKTYAKAPQQSRLLYVLDWVIMVVGLLAVVYTTYQILFRME
ncbi:hypothetical protein METBISCDRAFT_12309 [Metschnikowia bicuspidata]|uniref:Amino acid transporter transmembrane domain-containing protein n=1 Tax=Metschnikowia bicuspidata TaxID=27322 RepID=A0A4P9ZH65_9ASCO|nr:hypothetical protein METBISCDRAFT_12309 [Metschnikowia bicuspidata]